MNSTVSNNKLAIARLFESLQDPQKAQAAMAQQVGNDFAWHGPKPFKSCSSTEEWCSTFWLPFVDAFAGVSRETHMLFGGISQGKADNSPDGQSWVGATGYYEGVFSRSWLGFEPSHQAIKLRWGEFFRFEDGKIVEMYTLFDIIDFLQQINKNPLPPSHGTDFVYPSPAGINGILLDEGDASETAESMRLIREFLFEGLNNFDEENLASMGVADFFHDNINWYGPGGIGACLSLKEFQNYHQQHWLVAFPDRKVQDLDSLFAEGNFVGSSGWAGVTSQHTGRYLSAAATGNRINFNGMDFWLRRGDKFIENWVFVDMIDLFEQFGVDLLQQAREG